MSAPILFDQSRLKAYDGLMRLCEFAGKSGEWQQTLWSELLMNQNLYDAFVYYLESRIAGRAEVWGIFPDGLLCVADQAG